MDIINSLIGHVVRFFNNLVGNQYVLALLLFALLVEIILLPFGIKQQKNSIKQARLRPKEMAIRKKYAGREDQATKQKLQMEIQEFYQKEGYNPMGGCLPLLIQLPVIIVLYNVVINPLRYICQLSAEAIPNIISVVKSYPAELIGDSSKFNTTNTIGLMDAVRKIIEKDGVEVFSHIEGFADHIRGVEDIPNLSIFGGFMNLADIPSFTNINWLLLIPVLTFLSYYLSTKINRKLMYQPMNNDAAMGCSNKVMDLMMPLMSVFITFGVPAAMGVYWIFKCLLGIGKQAILATAMPLPKFTEEDYKAAEREYSVKAEKPRSKSTGKVRSLHRIDEEDDEEPTPVKKNTEAAPETSAEEKKDAPAGGLLNQGALKEDAPKHRNKKKKDNDQEQDSDETKTENDE